MIYYLQLTYEKEKITNINKTALETQYIKCLHSFQMHSLPLEYY